MQALHYSFALRGASAPDVLPKPFLSQSSNQVQESYV